MEWFPCKDRQEWVIMAFSWGTSSFGTKLNSGLHVSESNRPWLWGPEAWQMISTCNLERLSPPVSGLLAFNKVNREISPQQAFLSGGWHFLPAPPGAGMEGTHCWTPHLRSLAAAGQGRRAGTQFSHGAGQGEGCSYMPDALPMQVSCT